LVTCCGADMSTTLIVLSTKFDAEYLLASGIMPLAIGSVPVGTFEVIVAPGSSSTTSPSPLSVVWT